MYFPLKEVARFSWMEIHGYEGSHKMTCLCGQHLDWRTTLHLSYGDKPPNVRQWEQRLEDGSEFSGELFCGTAIHLKGLTVREGGG